MQPQIQNSFSNLSPADVAEFENEFQLRLPNDYKQFLLQSNGGHPEPSAFEVFRKGDYVLSSAVFMFAGIHAGQYDSLVRYVKTHSGRIPQDMLVIARDVVGNVICMFVKGDLYGKIYWWNHEGEAAPNPETMENVHLIADDFGSFLNKLKVAV